VLAHLVLIPSDPPWLRIALDDDKLCMSGPTGKEALTKVANWRHRQGAARDCSLAKDCTSGANFFKIAIQTERTGVPIPYVPVLQALMLCHCAGLLAAE
jgi:hypothetical protein